MLDIEVFGSSSRGNGYLLKDEDSHLMLEAGVKTKDLKVDWSKIEGLLLTHEHNDHAKFAKDYIKRGSFNLYCTQGTAEQLNGVADYRVMPCKSREPFTIKGWRVLPFDVEHDAADPVGYLISTPSGKKVLFATDTYYIRYKFKGVTHAMIECNYSFDTVDKLHKQKKIDRKRRNRLLTSHFEIENVIKFFKSNDWSRLEEVHLLHLSDSNSDAKLFKERVQATTGTPVYIA